MPGADIVRYLYESKIWPQAAISHCFNYISALTDIEFVRNSSSPQIFASDERESPVSARLILAHKDQNFSSGTIDKGCDLLDPIDFILRRLTLRLKKGPYFGEYYTPFENDYITTVSAAVEMFVNRLTLCGILRHRRQAINIWPDGARFAAALTHDIDIPKRTVAGSMRLLFKGKTRGKIRGLADAVVSSLKLADNPYSKVRNWINLENQLSIKSTYFIFAGERHFFNDPKYHLSQIAESLDAICKAGNEIGLHNSAGGYSGRGIHKAAEQLRHAIKGNVNGIRPHYLSADLPSYWIEGVKAGFNYSSCLGFDDRIGFECGIDLPIVPFDLDTGLTIPIVEIPIAIMDCGLMNQPNQSVQEAIEKGKSLIEKSAGRNAVVVFDWHPRSLYQPEFYGWGDAFRHLADFCLQQEGKFMKMGDIAALLRDRMKIQDESSLFHSEQV